MKVLVVVLQSLGAIIVKGLPRSVWSWTSPVDPYWWAGKTEKVHGGQRDRMWWGLIWDCIWFSMKWVTTITVWVQLYYVLRSDEFWICWSDLISIVLGVWLHTLIISSTAHFLNAQMWFSFRGLYAGHYRGWSWVDVWSQSYRSLPPDQSLTGQTQRVRAKQSCYCILHLSWLWEPWL